MRIREARQTGDGTYPGKIEWGAMYSSTIGGDLDAVMIERTREDAEQTIEYFRGRGANTALVRRVVPEWEVVGTAPLPEEPPGI